MPTVLSAEYPIHVETSGDDRRPALLLLNPLGTTLEVWDPMIETLAERNWVVRFDSRGHGRSETDVGEFDIADLVADAIAVLDALEIPRSHLLGDSMGAMVAATLAGAHQGRVDQLILASCGLYLGEHSWWDETMKRLEAGGLASITSHLEDIFFSEEWRAANVDALGAYREMFLATNPATYLFGAQTLRRYSLSEIGEQITASTLLIAGEDDPMYEHYPVTDLLSLIPGSEAVNVGGARHRVLTQEHAVLAPLINEFFSDPDAQ